MKVIFLLATLFLNSLFSVAQNVLTITVSNIPKIEGHIEIGLFNSADGFLDKEKAVNGIRLKVDSKTIHYTFKQLPIGRYAIAIIHDANNDKKLTTNFIGIPTEALGFSNNPTLYFGPPSFGKCSFEINSQKKTIEIELK